MHTSVDFSKNFCALLIQRGVTQLEFASMCGLHKQSIHRYATGKTLPGWHELVMMSNALGCTLDSFRTGVFIDRASSPVYPQDNKLEQIKPIIKELGSVVGKLTSFISSDCSAEQK